MRRFISDSTKRIEKLSPHEQEDMVFDLVQAFTQSKNIKDAAIFLQDLFTKSEMKILSKRLRIAKLLLAGMTYIEIESQLHASHGTVAKIAVWLSERGDGFRKVIENLPKESNRNTWRELSEWDQMKRKYPLYFWPELLLEEVITNASKKQKEHIKNVLKRLDEKTELHKRIEELMHR